MPAGLFITFEGGEGTGKSSHAKRLARRLTRSGRKVVLTREPGGTPQGEAVRGLLLHGEAARWSAAAEALLNYAARDAHLAGVIRPALKRGAIVISDRFMDSTRAYQGHAGGVEQGFLDRLEEAVVGRTRPGLTLVFDVDPKLGLERAGRHGGTDRFESRGLAFHRRLRKGFLEIARGDPDRCVVIDSARPVEEVAEDVWRTVAARLPR
ncbi:MAG: dTMP kinase [Parvibaculaceae bacterium]